MNIKQAMDKFPKSKLFIFFLITMILIAIALLSQLLIFSLNKDKIVKGVYLNDLNVGNLTKAELLNILKENFQSRVKDNVLTLKHRELEMKINFSDIGVNYNISRAIDQAYAIGRSGNLFLQVLNFGSPTVHLDIPTDYDREKLDETISSFEDKILKKVKQAELVFKDETVLIRSGHKGEKIDKTKLTEEIANLIHSGKGKVIEVPTVEVLPDKIDVDDLYKKISRPASNAAAKVEKNKIVIVPHTPGRTIDKTVLTALKEKIDQSEDQEFILAVSYTPPQLTSADVSKKLLKDTLKTFSTSFSTSTSTGRNRAENIKIAVSKINGKILAPGEVFSFNKIVGERDSETGYKSAPTYVNGKVVPGIGGGICQVSTTLYNTILPLNFQIIERTNHMFTVNYVPLGMDAAVAYGEVDLKFKNTTKWPVKIIGSVKGNTVSFSIQGTQETPAGRTIEYTSKVISSSGYRTKYIYDPTLKEGTTLLSHKGSKGYVVSTYKVEKQDGKIINQTKIYTSYYKPLNEEVIKGTKKVPSSKPAKT